MHYCLEFQEKDHSGIENPSNIFNLLFFLIYTRGDPYAKNFENFIFSEASINSFKTLEIEYLENFERASAKTISLYQNKRVLQH